MAFSIPIIQELMQDLLIEYFGMDLSSMMNISEDYGMGTSSSMASLSPMASSINLWQEMLSGEDGELINPILKKQYDLIYGSWPSAYNEIVLIVDENNEIDDMTLFALGLKSKDDIDALAQAAFDQTEIEIKDESWSYEEICDMDFRVVLGSDCYVLDESSGFYTDLRETQAGLKYLYDNGTNLTVSGILRQNEEAVSGMLTGSIAYTTALTEYIIEQSKQSDAVVAQLEDPSTDIFTGLPFRENTGNLDDAQKAKAFDAHINHHR